MQSLKSVSPTPDQPPCTSSVLAQATAIKPSARRYRFRPNSWLSTADANLLLSKRASLEAQKKNYPVAIQLLSRLISYDPGNANYCVNRGLMYAHLHQWESALADYCTAIALNPSLDKAYSNRANLHAVQENWAEAIMDYDQAIDLNPLNIRARCNQAITFREMGDYEEALACLDIALFFKPESATLYAERGRVYHFQGDWNCAVADYTRAITLTQRLDLSDLGDRHEVNRSVLNWMQTLISIA